MALDADYATGLADCASTDLVTSHAAFGYLAQRYGLTQRGITGLRPEDEPSPGALAEIADFVDGARRADHLLRDPGEPGGGEDAGA